MLSSMLFHQLKLELPCSFDNISYNDIKLPRCFSDPSISCKHLNVIRKDVKVAQQCLAILCEKIISKKFGFLQQQNDEPVCIYK